MTKDALDLKKQYMKQWREKHKKQINDYQRRWRNENQDKVKTYNAEYWERKANEKEVMIHE